LELEDASRYHKALKAQMLFWVVLLGSTLLQSSPS